MNKTNKEAILNVSGKTIHVNFGVNYFYKYFLEATGVDLIASGLIDTQSVKIFDYLAGFLYAGNKAHCSLTDQRFDLSKEKVEKMVYSMDEKGATELLTECLATMAGTTVDELKNGTTQAAKNRGKHKVS